MIVSKRRRQTGEAKLSKESERPAGRAVCFGEVMLRMTAPGRELLFQTGRIDVHVGGAEANVAVGLARLGHETAMVTRLPANRLGDAALGHLRRHGVDVSGVATAPGRMGLYFVSLGAGPRPSEIVYDREASSFALSAAGDYDWARLLEGADLLHLSGITPALGEGPAAAAQAAADAAAARGIRVAFDGNYRAQLWQRRGGDPRAVLRPLVAQAEILFGNHRDIALLLDRKFEGEGEARRQAAAEAAFAAFPRLRLIASTARHAVDAETHRISARIDGRDGSAQTDELEVTGIVDRIGAGDAFAAGVLHGLRLGRDPDHVARSGLALACLKHSLPGDVSLFGSEAIESFWSGERDVRR
jgi:2-dehydro-3-deoxygluconokinase